MREFLRQYIDTLVGITIPTPAAKAIGGFTEAKLLAVNEDSVVVQLKGRKDRIYVPFGSIKQVNELGDFKDMVPWPIGIVVA